MGKLKKKADIENCSNASPFFGHLLREKRGWKVVLPTVFEILVKDYCAEENSHWSTLCLFLKWRLVCKKWNWAIEELHQNEDARHYWMYDDRFDKAKLRQVVGKWGPVRFNRVSEVYKFLGHFEATHYSAVLRGRVSKKCPFLARSVHVHYYLIWARNSQTYLNRLKEMFQKFGDQVWYFKFSWKCCWQQDEHVDFYPQLKEMVELMPNLKALSVQLCESQLSFESSGRVSPSEPLEREIKRNPFPRLTKLEMISFKRIIGLLSNHLINQNQHISRLDMIKVDFNRFRPLFPNELPNLNHLSLVDVDSGCVLGALERYPFTLNLQRFALTLNDDLSFVQWSRVFNVLGSKIKSCTQLELQMPYPESYAERMSILQDSLKCRLPLANI